LLYRLNVIEVVLPSLRQRRKDIQVLSEHLLHFFARQAGKSITHFTEEARAALLRYPWPGNVRELRNAIERVVILATGKEVGLPDLPSQVSSTLPMQSLEIGGAVTLEQLEAEHIRRVIQNTETLEQAANVLGIDPSTLYRKRKRPSATST
jgi:NtrC-family two-component system response regulator AlgB